MTIENPEIELATGLVLRDANEACAICVFEDEPHISSAGGGATPRASVLSLVEASAARSVRDGEFNGKEGEALLVRVVPDRTTDPPLTLLLVGAGKHSDFIPDAARRAAATAIRRARAANFSSLSFVVPASFAGDSRIAAAVAEGACLGLYDGDFYQAKEEDGRTFQRLTIIISQDDGAIRAAVERARVIADATNWARRLADEPAVALPPQEFASRAEAMAGEVGLQVESLGPEAISGLGMGGLLGVARGSDEPPALIVLRYLPPEPAPDDEVWAFVGKGITFDSGGISLKRGPGMEEMKSDMAGGAAVLGALRAIAQLKPRRQIVGIVPAAENMPSGKALKPGDVLRTLGGYTIEVADTDAEGRLVLVDGIAYARRLGASRIVDLATLTGSIIVALGDVRAGLFSNNDEWAARVGRAAEEAGERVWRMPVSDDYKKRIESEIADFKNYGGRPDATAAALLLSKFAGATAWAHLDIAGTAWYDKEHSWAPAGATGAGVRTLVQLASSQ